MRPINTKLAPEAIGTYSQAIRYGEAVYLSGQIPLNPTTMQICSEDIKLQINQVIENLSAVCEAAGGTIKGNYTHIKTLCLINYVTVHQDSEKVAKLCSDGSL